ncbi:FabD/lysophospholipase-like protein [Hypoxylon crocopeplum]|nr:FabD/lysophospholipase-like protein [Hypoxylon crocopeplum]
MSEPGPSSQATRRGPWLKKHVLTFDGGGVRGYYSLLFILRLMQYIGKEENRLGMAHENNADTPGANEKRITSFYPCDEPNNLSHLDDNEYTPFLPCHYFDYIAGTSTGGLIAIMLGRFRMTVEDCIHEYRTLLGKVFGRPRFFHHLNSGLPWCKYNTGNFEKVIKDVVVRRVEKGRNDLPNARFDTESGLCRVLVIANMTESKGVLTETRLFRSYEIKMSPELGPRSRQITFTRALSDLRDEHGGKSGDFCIWQVARATTAAPMYFRPLKLMTDGNTARGRTNSQPPNHNNTAVPHRRHVETLEDGGLGPANNPSNLTYDELKKQMHNTDMKVGTLVSIGTARPMEQPSGPRILRVVKSVVSRYGDPEPTHWRMEQKAQEDPSFLYYRFNEPLKLSGVDMDDWKPRKTGINTIETMTNAFNSSVSEPDMVDYMQACARELVEARRARVDEDPAKWNRYALGRYFECGIEGCPDDFERETKEENFIAHLRNRHNMDDDEINAALRDCSGQWTYRGR